MAIKSMTGFGRAQVQESGIQVTAEVLSVNRKHLDINVVIPKHLMKFDPVIRKLIAEGLLRGHVTVRIAAVFIEEAPLSVQPNLAMAKQYFQGWKEIAEALSLDYKSALSLSLLEKETDLFVYKETEKIEVFEKLVVQVVGEALKPFTDMRLAEGRQLQEDIIERLSGMKRRMDQIVLLSPESIEKYRNKLIERIKTFLPSIDGDDESLLKEIVLFAARVDVTEETVRFYSHIEQFMLLFKEGPPAAGKTAEFLVQELGREINTIGSKCSDIAITKQVLEIKTDIERIREQIQNVE